MRILTLMALVTSAVWSMAVVHATTGRPPAVSDGRIAAPLLLSQTGLYADIAVGRIDARNRPFSPQYPLWTDGAEKSRWLYLPPGAVIDASDVMRWDVPVGTRFWKEFRFGGRKVETRLIWRATRQRWVFASYVWNAAQSEARLADERGVPGVADVGAGRQHDIPSVADCQTCHGAGPSATPLGFNALQLSTDRDPQAIHGEPLRPDMLTVATLHEEGRLSPARPELLVDPPRIRASAPATRTVLGYFAANCGSCHNGRGEIAALVPSLAAADIGDGDAVARRLIDHPSRWQVPHVPEGASVLIDPRAPAQSAMLVRMRSRRPASQMPPLGTVVRDTEALAVIERWLARDLEGLRAGR